MPTTDKNLLAALLPCTACGNTAPRLESTQPEGRLKPIYRVVCECGNAYRQWSVTPQAAVRAWNRDVEK